MNKPFAFIILAVALLLTSGTGYARPGPFVFAYDLQGPGAATIAAAIGLNTIHLQVGAEHRYDLSPIRSQMAEAQQLGIKVIVALPTIPPGPLGITATDADFASYVRTFVGDIVTGLRDEPALAGWAMADYLQDALRYTDQEFAEYLQQRYGSLELLNAAWNTTFADWSTLPMTPAVELDDEEPFAVGRPSVDLADYQRETYTRVLDFWAQQVRALDADTPLLTGRIAFYRSLTAVPDSYDIVVPAISPAELEADQLAHNVHAIDIARQAGRFEVIRTLHVPIPGESLYQSNVLEQWIGQAALHGAVGIGLDNFARLVASQLLPTISLPITADQRTALASSELARIVRAALERKVFTVQPRANAAFLYEPYAEGHQLQELPVYGYISGFSEDEPNNLFVAFRRGGCFGLVDYLTPAALRDSSVDLDHYSFIAAPLSLNLPGEVVARLSDYVRDGGVLVADLGAGTYQSGSWQRLPAKLGQLLGVEVMPMLRAEVGDFSFGRTSEHFPSMQPPLKSQGTFMLHKAARKSHDVIQSRERTGRVDELRPYSFGGPTGFAKLLPGTMPWAISKIEYDDNLGQMFSGIVLHEYGLGLGVFCTTRLWANWAPGDPAFQAFHYDLWARRAAYELHTPGLFAGEIELCTGDDSFWLLNLGRDMTLAEIIAHQANNRIYAGGFCQFSATDRQPSGRRSGRVVVTVPVPRLRLTKVMALPVEIKPHYGEVSAVLFTCRPDLVDLQVAGSGAALRSSRSSGWQLGYGAPTPVRITLRAGEYAIAPLSRHQVEVDYDLQPLRRLTIHADHSGRLRFDINGRRARVTITSLP